MENTQKRRKTMANANYQVSSKLNDGRIFVIAGDTADEFKANLTHILGSVGAEDLISTMATSIEGAPLTIESAVANLAQGLGARPVSSPTQTFTPSTGPSGKTCKHGEMTKRTGAGAKGPWKAFMCPSPKGTPDQCEPVWIRRTDSEWNTF
jgi:hypothetical protein